MDRSRRFLVLPHGPGFWSVRREGQDPELSTHPSHAEAEQVARAQARAEQAPLLVETPAGTRQQFPAEQTPPDDPVAPEAT